MDQCEEIILEEWNKRPWYKKQVNCFSEYLPAVVTDVSETVHIFLIDLQKPVTGINVDR